MNTLKDTLATMGEEARGMAELLMEQATEMFHDIGKVNPGMFAWPMDSDKPLVEDVEVLDDDTKPIVWAKLRRWREKYPVTAFVSEVWVSAGKEWERNRTMPRDDPNRKEKVMLQMFVGTRLITFAADLTGKPKQMGKWKVFYDSMFPGKKGANNLGGAMIEGRPCPIEGN